MSNPNAITSNSSLHALLLLSDSALPLGSFAFSSGLESFLAHSKSQFSSSSTSSSKLTQFETFLSHSLRNISSTSLPYVVSAFHFPSSLPDLDNDFDASTPCTVARRASITQGRALLALWERALAASADPASPATQAVASFSATLKAGHIVETIFNGKLEAHFSPLFGSVCAALFLSAHDTAYLFLLNHAKAVLSAAVRASVMGPYQSHSILASASLQRTIESCIAQEQGKEVSDASVMAPMMDLWMGRHELLYSRIFNS